MKKTIKKTLVLMLLLALSCVHLFAQGGPGIPGGDNDDPCADPDSEACLNPAPLDDWLIILVTCGLILATWYLHNKQKKEAIL